MIGPCNVSLRYCPLTWGLKVPKNYIPLSLKVLKQNEKYT